MTNDRPNRAIRPGARVCLFIAALFAAAGAQAGGLHGRIPGRLVAAAADLDGDRRVDVATAGASRREAAGYVFDITIRLSTRETGAVTVRTPRAAGSLYLRDLDGDADRDLVVEAFDREPLAVLLNDGSGHFHQANLEDYRARLSKPTPRSIDAPSPQSQSLDTGESADGPAAAPTPSQSAPALAVRAAALRGTDHRVFSQHTVRATRGPPSPVRF